jgi:hypothetical protein
MILNKQDMTPRDILYLQFLHYFHRINNMTEYVIFNKIYKGTCGRVELKTRSLRDAMYIYIDG